MATTILPEYLQRQIKNPSEGVGWEDAVTALRIAATRFIESAQGDCDKAGDVEDAAYYEGQVDVLTWLLDEITVVPVDEQRERLERQLDAIRRAIDSTDRDSQEFLILHDHADRIAQQIHDLQQS